ncbi:MAG TPA: lipid A biosynthesis acyltransferase, partial [Candidatus Marinimicrobia bacterium]|nr:lipid A biosynthesis acyltransferase [Candidatus Neomarinimicrobiota bacterium]
DKLPDSNGSESVMERFTALLEKEIRQRPEQYFWFHRRWKTPPSKKP